MSDQNLCESLLKTYDYNPATAFQEIMRLQRTFSSRFTPYDKLADGDLRLHWAREYIVSLMDEVQEVIGWLPWKHWKHYPEYFELKLEELRFELIDILHFMMDLSFVIEMDWSSFNICRDMDKFIEEKRAAVGDEDSAPYDIQAQTEATKAWACRMYKHLGDIEASATDNNWDNSRSCYAKALLAFYDGLALWDMDGETINNYYRSKNAENIDRQNRGY